MQWAEGGSLDDLIDTRLGRPTHLPAFPPSSPSSPSSPAPSSPSPASPDHQSPQGEHHHTTEHRHQHSRSARIRAFRALQRAPPEDKARLREKLGLGAGSPGAGAAGGGAAGTGAGGTGAGAWKAVHLFSAEEVRGLFSDVVEGLAFLVRVCSFFLSFFALAGLGCVLRFGFGFGREPFAKADHDYYRFYLYYCHCYCDYARTYVRYARRDVGTRVQHDKSILHLDHKPGNVLLTWDEGKLMCVSLCVSFLFGGALPRCPLQLEYTLIFSAIVPVTAPARCYLISGPRAT